MLGRAPKNTLPPFNFARNRYPAKKKWPPNLRELTERQQFRFERKFKRRLRMKSIKPTWNKWVKIVQWTLIGGITVYTFLFYDFAEDPMNPRPGEQPFQGLREKFWGMFGDFYTHTATEEYRRRRALREAEKGGEKAPEDERKRLPEGAGWTKGEAVRWH